jgi:ketosteroid isomerase-like protein
MFRSVWVLSFVMAFSVACRPSANVEQERNALLQRDREWSQTAKDPAKFATFFAADGSIYPPGMPLITGTEAIQKAFTEMSSAPGFALQWASSNADVSGDLGYTTGTYEMTMGGTPEKGKYVTIWKKQSDGTWKVSNDIFNADAAPAAPASQMAAIASADLKWGPAPPMFSAGAKAAVVSGDPSQAAPYVIRLQMPAGYKIAPHWHPTDENVTVLSGTIAVGMGDTFDQPAMKDLPAGGYGVIPAQMHHFAMAKTPTTIQVHGMGPFVLTYINAADDPRKPKS